MSESQPPSSPTKSSPRLSVTNPDWRGALRLNKRRTFFVIFLFIMIYVCLGALIDIYLNTTEKIPVETTVQELIAFKIFPLITAIMIIVAIGSVTIMRFFHNSIMMMGTEYREIEPNSKNFEEKQFYNIIEELKIASGLGFMPKVYIIEANYMNAFASGWDEKSSMVAITRGLLDKLDRSEVQAVMAHEISHIRHGDMRLTISVAILSNLMLIVIDLVFRGILFGGSRSRDNRLVTLIIILRFVLPIITLLLVLYLSRTREFMADAGSVELLRDNEPLARALLKIDRDTKSNDVNYSQDYSRTPNEGVRQASYFYDPNYAGIEALNSINGLFSSHPSLEERLKALGVSVQ